MFIYPAAHGISVFWTCSSQSQEALFSEFKANLTQWVRQQGGHREMVGSRNEKKFRKRKGQWKSGDQLEICKCWLCSDCKTLISIHVCDLQFLHLQAKEHVTLLFLSSQQSSWLCSTKYVDMTEFTPRNHGSYVGVSTSLLHLLHYLSWYPIKENILRNIFLRFSLSHISKWHHCWGYF